MNLNVGYIPYLNMAPFHREFGPAPVEADGLSFRFRTMSPRTLGIEAEAGRVDAGAMSLADTFRLSDRFEPAGSFGIGVHQAAGSVLLFSKQPVEELSGLCAITDETATSVRLLEVLLRERYQRDAVSFGRIASVLLYDGSAEALLLIGDDALRARQSGVKGLPCVTDLGQAWFDWQGTPFVFARWVVRKDLPETTKDVLVRRLEHALKDSGLHQGSMAREEAAKRGFSSTEVAAYWEGFHYTLTPPHEASIRRFQSLLEARCLKA